MLIAVQSVNITSGVPLLWVPETYDHESNRTDVSAALPPTIRFQTALVQIHAEAILNIERNALYKSPDCRDRMLDSMINEALSKLKNVENECSKKLGTLSHTLNIVEG